ncbi:MAG TPA: hypothetical protein VHS99_19725 [Chloroflexota bacterium]|jgi:hypothetical protein|nr:hypothetical protein [Chloroflexota bacterium]
MSRLTRALVAARRAGPMWRVVWVLAALGATAIGVGAPSQTDFP